MTVVVRQRVGERRQDVCCGRCVVRQRIIPFIPLTFGLLLTTSGLTVFTGGAPAAEECITQPDYKQQGGHWHYRTDRNTNTKCWFLRPDDGEVQGVTDTADADAEDGAAVARQAAPRPVQRKPQQVTQQPAQQTARSSRSPDTNTPASAAPTQGSTAGAPSNASANTAPWPWPSDRTVTQPAAPVPQPQTQPSTNDLPKPVTPIRGQGGEQPPQNTKQPPPAPTAQEPPTPQAQGLTEPVASL